MTRGGRGDMKSFYRQQKTHAAAAATTKPTGGVSKKAVAHHHKKAALATNVHPAPDHGAGSRQQEEAEAEQRERAGHEFDMDTCYGPWLGVTRAQWWRRAAALGLAPPPALLALCADEQPCLWEGRV